MRRVLAIAAAAIVAACSPSENTPDAGPSCGLAYLGDRNKPIEVELRVLGADGNDLPLKEGDAVPLVFPPQGGRVVFVGVRATNLDPCAVQLTGAIRDLPSQQVRVDARTVNLVPDGKGWGLSGASSQSVQAAVANYANVPLCPNQWASTATYDTPFGLEVTLKDQAKRTVTKAITVTPFCGEPSNLAECRCICKKDYVLGESCASDAGISDGGVIDP